MKIAIPVEMGQVCPHFGHAPEFVVAITEEGKIIKTETHENPGHEPGRLPAWLAGLGVHGERGYGIRGRRLMGCCGGGRGGP